jgi:hypothetical protein
MVACPKEMTAPKVRAATRHGVAPSGDLSCERMVLPFGFRTAVRAKPFRLEASDRQEAVELNGFRISNLIEKVLGVVAIGGQHQNKSHSGSEPIRLMKNMGRAAL